MRNFLAERALRRANWLRICASLSIGEHRKRIAIKALWWADASSWLLGQARWADLRNSDAATTSRRGRAPAGSPLRWV